LPSSFLALVAGFVLANTAGAQSSPRPDSALVRWARVQAVALAPVDAVYRDSSFAFLDRTVGNARILAFGEPVHGGHEPLVFRNRLIRYVVERLGFTAVAVESGLTEAMLADDFVQGGPGNVDSVVRHGFTWSFQFLPENRELLIWLREHNAHAARKVHLYGIDLTGSEDVGAFPNGARAVRAAISELARANPARGAELGARLEAMMDRFLPARFGQYSASDRARLRAGLDTLYRALRGAPPDSDPDRQRRRMRGLRNGWMAIRLDELLTRWGRDGTPAGAALRDSTMAENTRWVVEEEGGEGRIVLFAHDGHIKNSPTVYRGPKFSGSWKVQGQYLRTWFGPKLVTIGSVGGMLIGNVNNQTGWLKEGPETPAESGTFAAALKDVGLRCFVLDLRSGDQVPIVRAAISRPWVLQAKLGVSLLRPRRAFDAIVYFDRVSPTTLLR
jgi:erythromycin esterase